MEDETLSLTKSLYSTILVLKDYDKVSPISWRLLVTSDPSLRGMEGEVRDGTGRWRRVKDKGVRVVEDGIPNV